MSEKISLDSSDNVGISNKSYFYREFARKYNMTPKEYRTKEA